MARQPDAGGLELLRVPAEDPVRVAVRHQLAVRAQRHHPGDERKDLVEAMLDEHDRRRVAIDDPAQQVDDEGGSVGIQVGRRLVEQDEPRS